MISRGMPHDEVLRIMGQKGLEKSLWGLDSVYTYEADIRASSNIEIIFNEKMEVEQIIKP